MVGVRKALPLALGISALALLGACDNGPSAVSQQAAGTQMATSAPQGAGSGDAAAVAHRQDPVALSEDGRPMWAPTRRTSAQAGPPRAFTPPPGRTEGLSVGKRGF